MRRRTVGKKRFTIELLGHEWVHEVAQSCPTLYNPMDCSPSGSSVHGIFQARVLEWVAISFSRRSFQPRDWTRVSHIVGFTVWATREAQNTGLWAKPECTRSILVNITWPRMRFQPLYIHVNCWHFLNFLFQLFCTICSSISLQFGLLAPETPVFWPPDAKSRLIWKDPFVGKDWRQEEKGTTEDEVVGWHHRLNVHEFG